MAQAKRVKNKYVPAWMTPAQYEKLAAIRVLRRSRSINAVICDIVDNVNVQLVFPSDAVGNAPTNDKVRA